MTPRARLYAYEAAARHGCGAGEVLSPMRGTKAAIRARFEVMRRLRADGHTPAAIGRMLGRDRTTVIHGLGVAAPGLWFA